MMQSIDTKIGPSRTSPFRVADRTTPPAGTRVPRPFDIHHGWRQPQGRSTGGAFFLTPFETMDWSYNVGTTEIYAAFMSLYMPQNPWVWVQFFDIYTNAAAWYEACLLEPRLDRGAGITVSNVVVSFIHLSPYTP